MNFESQLPVIKIDTLKLNTRKTEINVEKFGINVVIYGAKMTSFFADLNAKSCQFRVLEMRSIRLVHLSSQSD